MSPEETSREFNSMFRRAVKFAVGGPFPSGLAFYTPGDNLRFNPDRTVDWSVELSSCFSGLPTGEAVAHAFLQITTGSEVKHTIVFGFCSNEPSNWERLKQFVETSGPDGSALFTLAPSLVDPAFTLKVDTRPAKEILDEAREAKAFNRLGIPNCAFCTGHFKDRKLIVGPPKRR